MIDQIVNYVSLPIMNRTLPYGRIWQKISYESDVCPLLCRAHGRQLFSAMASGGGYGSEQAKLLKSGGGRLRNPSLVGYNETRLSLSEFRQETGMTPKKYRDSFWVGTKRRSKMDEFYTWMNRHEQEFLQDLITMIGYGRSVSRVGEWIGALWSCLPGGLVTMLQIAASYGFEVRDCDGHAGEIFYSKGCTGLDIGIWGHLDVVPEGEGWSYPPYELSREGDFLIGRGVQDNKGPLLAVLYAMRFLKEQKWQPNNGYRLIFGCDEERGMKDVAYFLAHRKAPDYSFVADCGFPVCRGEKGMLVLEIKKEVPAGKISSLKSGLVINSVPGTACAVCSI